MLRLKRINAGIQIFLEAHETLKEQQELLPSTSFGSYSL